MASNVVFIILFIFVSLSLTSVYSLSTKDFTPTSDQESSVVDVEDIVKGRLLARVSRSDVVLNKTVHKTTSNKSSKKKHKSKKIGSLDVGAAVGIIIAAIVVTILIICVIYFFYLRRKTKQAQSIEQEKTNGSSDIQTSKTEDHV